MCIYMHPLKNHSMGLYKFKFREKRYSLLGLSIKGSPPFIRKVYYKQTEDREQTSQALLWNRRE